MDNFLAKMAAIGPISIVTISVSLGVNDRSVFRNIGSCDLEYINCPEDLDKLLNYYMVWYKPNVTGQAGWNILGSDNYKAIEYIDGIHKSQIIPPRRVNDLVTSLASGINENVEIMVAHDQILNKSLIVDGTKRAIALLLLKQSNSDIMEKIFNSGYSITINALRSNHCSVVFPCDFFKLAI